MPKGAAKLLEQVVEEIGVYPAEAYRFVQQGLTYTVAKVHGEKTDPDACRHISGRDLCFGLRDLAHQQWGLMARLVLARWNITTTMDFGRIVFAMVQHDLLQKTEQDTIDDFRAVFDFGTELDAGYRVQLASVPERPRKPQKKA